MVGVMSRKIFQGRLGYVWGTTSRKYYFKLVNGIVWYVNKMLIDVKFK